MQLNDALCVTIPATLSAWNSSSRSLQPPGTTTTGVTLPSSLVTGFWRSGAPRAIRSARSGPGGPHTMRSWVRFEPVMCTSSTAGWLAR